MKRLAVSLALSRRSRPQELLLVERSKKLRSFEGVFAFPGGKLDADDESIPVRGLTGRVEVGAEAEAEAMSRFIVAGARELFEETGIWLGKGGDTPETSKLREDRRRLLAEEVAFSALLERNGQYLDAGDLVPLCRMTTPPFAAVRFDTWFLRGLVPDDTEIEIWDGELVDGDFVDPQKTLARWKNGELQIAPPMVVLLEEWAKGPEALGERIRALAESYEAGKASPHLLLARDPSGTARNANATAGNPHQHLHRRRGEVVSRRPVSRR